MSVAPRTASAGRRLGTRTLPSLLRYKFLHEYGYDKGEVVAAAIVDDICAVVANYYSRPEHLEPGQLVYHCPSATEKARKGKTMANTALVAVRLTLVAHEDIDAIASGLPVWQRREIRLRRLAHEAYAQGGVLSELDLSVFTGYSEGGVSSAVLRLRARGEILPLRGYVADMGSWPTHKAAIVRLYLEGLMTPEIASRTYHSKRSVDRYIEGFERVRLLEAKYSREELLVADWSVTQRRRPVPGHPRRAPARTLPPDGASCLSRSDEWSSRAASAGPQGTEAKRRPLTTTGTATARIDLAPPTGRGLPSQSAARSAAHLLLFGGTGARASHFMYVINQNVYEPLIYLGSDFSLKPGLATTWQLRPDNRTWRFDLRRGVSFHDGTPFTADDVVWTWGPRQAEGRSLATVANTLHPPGQATPNLDAVRKVDDFTVDFTPIEPNFRLPEQMVHSLGAIVKNGTHNDTPPYAGTGPLKYASYVEKQTAAFERNDNYWVASGPRCK